MTKHKRRSSYNLFTSSVGCRVLCAFIQLASWVGQRCLNNFTFLFLYPLFQPQCEELFKEGVELEEKSDAGKTGFFGGTKKKINKFGERVQDIEDRYGFSLNLQNSK